MLIVNYITYKCIRNQNIFFVYLFTVQVGRNCRGTASFRWELFFLGEMSLGLLQRAIHQLGIFALVQCLNSGIWIMLFQAIYISTCITGWYTTKKERSANNQTKRSEVSFVTLLTFCVCLSSKERARGNCPLFSPERRRSFGAPHWGRLDRGKGGRQILATVCLRKTFTSAALQAAGV